MELPSKNHVVINPCGFDDACDLKDIVELKLAEADIKIETLDVANLDIGFLVAAILKVDGSKEFRARVFKCLERSLYNDEKITKDTFEPVENRGDYYPIVIECLKVNVLPFFYPLLGKWTGFLEKMNPKSPAPESPPAKSI